MVDKTMATPVFNLSFKELSNQTKHKELIMEKMLQKVKCWAVFILISWPKEDV